MNAMKFAWLLVLLFAVNAVAQEPPTARRNNEITESVAYGAWDFGVEATGGPGLGERFNTKFVAAGFRVGKILTKEHGSGWARGNFEWAVEAMPVYTVLTPHHVIYGGGFKPAILRWNFTSGRHIAPYASLAGGIVFSTHNVPPGNTSYVNFTPQAAVGAHFFVKPGQAISFEGAAMHESNAKLGTENPGYNIALVFTIGYTWFKSPG
jgi:hypothetical protein